MNYKKRPPRTLAGPQISPCARCPKYKLYPENYGLMRENEVPAMLFSRILKQERVGMDGILCGVMQLQDALSIIEVHRDLFRNSLEAQSCLTKMQILSQAVLKLWSERENKEREEQRQIEENKAKQRR